MECEGATFESAGPRGAGELCRSFVWPTSLDPAFSRPASSTLDGETCSGPEEESGFIGVAVVDGETKVVTGCCWARADEDFDTGLEDDGFETSSEGVSNSGGGT